MQKIEKRVQTIEEIMKELAIAQKDTQLELQELRAIQKETQLGLQELKIAQDRTQRNLDKLSLEMKDFKDEMKDFKDEAKDYKKEMNKKWGEMANRLGTIVEDIVAPSISGIAERYFGCKDMEDFMVRRFKRSSIDKARRREFDIIAVCEDKVILNETKSTPRLNHVESFINFIKNNEFYQFFPEYKDKYLIPIFSSLYLPNDIIETLSENKIYALAMSDDTMDIINFNNVI